MDVLNQPHQDCPTVLMRKDWEKSFSEYIVIIPFFTPCTLINLVSSPLSLLLCVCVCVRISVYQCLFRVYGANIPLVTFQSPQVF